MTTSALVPYQRLPHLEESLASCQKYFDTVLAYGDQPDKYAFDVATELATRNWMSSQHVFAFEARNRLLERSTADIIVFHDSDDYRLPATAQHLEYLASSNFDVLITPYEGRSVCGDVIIDIARGNVQTGGIYIKRKAITFKPLKAFAWEYWLLHSLWSSGCTFGFHNSPGVHYRKNWSKQQITEASYGYVVASRTLCLHNFLSAPKLSPCQYNALKQRIR